MTDEAVEARRAYQREYNRTHREQRNKWKRDYYARNKDKIKGYQEKHWQKVADEANGITAID